MAPHDAPSLVRPEREEPDTLTLHLMGNWRIDQGIPAAEPVVRTLEPGTNIARLRFESASLEQWDSSLLLFVNRVLTACRNRGVAVEREGLPAGARRLLQIAADAAPGTPPGDRADTLSWPGRIGARAIAVGADLADTVTFIGECTLTTLNWLRGRARFRGGDLMRVIQGCGPQALPIVSLISVLVGLILAFVGAIQLEMFGAEIYVANLVGIAMAREMGAMMAAVIMAGRTGAAFAAQIGTMQVNEETDALATMGISPMAFLVLPRLLALILMMPLLCLYANLMGICGGAIVGIGILDITPMAYLQQTRGALALHHFGVGLVKSAVFGVLVAVSGCMRGMQCGRSASAVGDAATSAVVTAIVWIIVTDAVITVIASILKV